MAENKPESEIDALKDNIFSQIQGVRQEMGNNNRQVESKFDAMGIAVARMEKAQIEMLGKHNNSVIIARTMVIIVAIFAIAFLEKIALLMGLDGHLFLGVVIMIGLLALWELKEILMGSVIKVKKLFEFRGSKVKKEVI